MRARRRHWNAALDAAEEEVTCCPRVQSSPFHPDVLRVPLLRLSQSLAIQLSAVTHIAKALARIGLEQQELALQSFDLVLRDCSVDEIEFMLVIKVSICIFLVILTPVVTSLFPGHPLVCSGKA